MHTNTKKKKSAGVYFLSHSIQNESIFSVLLVLYMATINKKRMKLEHKTERLSQS